MAIRTQRTRQLALNTSLGGEILVIERLAGRDRLGEMFEYAVTASAQYDDFDFDELLGKAASVGLNMIETGAASRRYFHGFVSQVVHTGHDHHGLSRYELTLVPWLWFLTLSSNCRIYQEMSVPEILEKIFNESGFSDYQLDLRGNYPSRDYCVQYRESDFNFVQRLMEHEGIYYYWKHSEERHIMVICDSMQVHEPVEGFEEVIYRPLDSGARDRDFIHSWKVRKMITSGAYSVNSFDFKAPTPSPNSRLLSRDDLHHAHSQGDREVYDNPGDYVERSEGERYARIRREEEQAATRSVIAQTNARGLVPGVIFTPLDVPQENQSQREYLVTAATFQASAGNFGSGSSSGGEAYSCSFEAMPVDGCVFRPARRARVPFVKGPQTAIVTGPSGEEIHVDDYGRVKVQFHWDREGKYDESTSCWVRASQPWASMKYGGLAVPRIGQEVIIDFLEGDPDRPILTGRVYNGESMPIVSNAGRDDNPARASREAVKKNRKKRNQQKKLTGGGRKSK